MKRLLSCCLMFALFSVAVAHAQQRTVTGTVTEASDGMPAAAVAIVEKGTSNGTLTGADGSYSITLTGRNPVLIFSFLGLKPVEIVVGDNRVINVAMEQDVQQLEDVIVVAYGTAKKSSYAGSAVLVKSEAIKDLPVTSFQNALNGKVAGLTVTSSSGQAGQAPNIRIRGNGSMNAGNEPLYVVDGVPVISGDVGYVSDWIYTTNNVMNTINPEDIESIEILKDAASAAIYGSRAAGGVVMITTKRGKEGKIKVDFNYQHSVNKLHHKVDLLNAREFAELFVDARNNTYKDLLINAGKTWDDSYFFDNNAERIQKIGSNNAAALLNDYFYDFAANKVKTPTTDTDWQDELYRAAPGDRYHVNISGGTNKIRYNVSGSYQKNDGIIITTKQDRINFRSNIDADINDKISVGANVALTSNQNREVSEGRFMPVMGALMYMPIFKCYDENGNIIKFEQAALGSEYAVNTVENPVARAVEEVITRNGIRNTYNVFGTYKIIPNLIAKINAGMYQYTEKYEYYLPTSLSNGAYAPYSPQAKAAANSVARSLIDYDYLGEFTLSYNKTISEHTIQGVIGSSVQKNKRDVLEVQGKGYQDDHIPEVTGHGADPSDVELTSNTLKSNWTMASFFGQLNYNYHSRYFLMASFRGDGSSLFGPLNRWGYFPSVSAGWTISNEDFYQNALGASSSLKLRASWGLSGNNSIGNYNWQQVMSSPTAVVLANAIESAMYPDAFKDRSLGWESTSQFNIGADFSLFDGRLAFIANYYNSNTNNLLFNQSISAITGTTSYLTNLPNSKIRNRGVDIQVDGLMVNEKDFSLKIGGNFSINRNTMVDLGGASTILTNGAERSYMTHITREGDPIGMFYGFQVAGMVRESDMANIAEDDKYFNTTTRTFPEGYKIKGPPRSLSQTTKLQPGDLYFVDLNGDGIVDDNDKDIIGSPHPDFIYAFNIAATFKSFDLTASFNGSQGNMVLDGEDYYVYNMEGSQNQYKIVADRYRNEQNPGNGIVYRASRGGTQSNSTRLSSFYLQDGSYFRCTNITLGYSVPGIGKASSNAISNLRIYGAIDNAFTITKFMGYNPEVDYNNGSNLTPGVNYGKYPLVSAFHLGAQISF